MRLAGLVLLAASSSAWAQPAPIPAPLPGPPMPAPAPAAATEERSLQLRAGLGVGRYREFGRGWTWQSELQPFALVGAEGRFPAGRGQLVLQAQAGFGSDVHMTSSGSLMQENDFHQQIFELGPRYRHPISPAVYVEAGYRFTLQRLFFTNIPALGDALETVSVHALEGGLGWRDSTREVAMTLGFNRGSAENDRIEGEDFSAGGISFDARAGKRWPSGFAVGGHFAYRKQNGSDVATVTFDGVETQAMWPNNVTWQLVAVLGLAL